MRRELRPAPLTDAPRGFCNREGRPIRARARHGVEAVRHRHDRGVRWQRGAGKAVGVAQPVPALMMVPHGGQDVLGEVRQAREHALAPHGVLAQASDVRRLAVAGRAHVRWQTAAAVAAVHAELADLPGPDPRAAARARARGWLVPWWWDEDTIDRAEHDPVTAAANAVGQDCQPCPDDQRELIRRLSATLNERTGRSYSAREIAARLGVSARTVVRHRAAARTISASHARTPQPDPSTRGRSCSTLTCDERCARSCSEALPSGPRSAG